MLQRFLKIVDTINNVLLKLLGVAMLLMTVFVTIQVISRYIFNFSIPWTEEMARYLMIWAAFIGATIGMRKGSLIALELLIQVTPKNISKMLQIIAHVISFVFLFVFFKYGIDMVKLSGGEMSPVTKIPMIIVYLSMPVSMILMVVNNIAVFIEKNLLDSREVN